LPDGLPVWLSHGDPRVPQPRAQPLRGRPRERAADPAAGLSEPRSRAAVDPGLQGLRIRPADLRRDRDPRADERSRRRRGSRLDAVESPERLHRRRAAAERGLRSQVKLLLVLSLILTAALLLVSFAGAAELAPNELGRVMILEYDKIDYPEERWTRTPENLRRDLETLYAKGYRLINLGDLLDRRIVLPAGTTPVVLTFDDSSPGQFRYLEKNGTLEIDPKCGVGILEAFFKEHPDFGRGGTFYVRPGASPPN